VHELDEKLERMARVCSAHHLGGVLLTTQLFRVDTGGHRSDGSRAGNGAIFVTDGGRFVANSIEMPRLRARRWRGRVENRIRGRRS
jgi:hypothetical protein